VRAADNFATFMSRLSGIREPQSPEILKAWPDLFRDCFTSFDAPRNFILHSILSPFQLITLPSLATLLLISAELYFYIYLGRIYPSAFAFPSMPVDYLPLQLKTSAVRVPSALILVLSFRVMLFYRTRTTNLPSTRRGVSLPFTTAEPGEALHLTWMLKSFAMGVTLLGLSYWLVQLAGFQYLASLTSVTLLAFLMAYVVWCVLHRNKIARQVQDSSTTDSSIDFMGRYFQRVTI